MVERPAAAAVFAVVLVLVGLSLVVWSAAAFHEQATLDREQDRYDAAAAEALADRVYRFEDLTPAAQNVTSAALRDEIATTAPVPPEFATDRTREDTMDPTDAGAETLDYYVQYREEVYRLAVSANRTRVEVVNRSLDSAEGTVYSYTELTAPERGVVAEAINSSSSIEDRPAEEVPHLEAGHTDEEGSYLVIRDGRPLDVDVRAGTGPNRWLFVVVPAFVLGVLTVVGGIVGWMLSATDGPAAILAGLAVLVGPPALTELPGVQPLGEPRVRVVLAPVVTGTVYLLLALRRRATTDVE